MLTIHVLFEIAHVKGGAFLWQKNCQSKFKIKTTALSTKVLIGRLNTEDQKRAILIEKVTVPSKRN